MRSFDKREISHIMTGKTIGYALIFNNLYYSVSGSTKINQNLLMAWTLYMLLCMYI